MDARTKVRLIKGFLTVVGIFVTAMIGGLVNQYFRRAQPHVELAAIELTSYRSPNLRIDIPPELPQMFDRVPISLEKSLSESSSLEEWDKEFRKVEQFKNDLARQKDTLSKILAQLDSRAEDSFDDETRAEFIKLWASAPGNYLEFATRGILDREGYLERIEAGPELQKYKVHPAEWKEGPKARIKLSEMSNYSLAEEPIDNEAAPDRKRQIAILNLYKRIWIYQEKHFMKEVFGKVLAHLNQLDQDASGIVQLMAAKTEQFLPKRIKCTVVLSNLGEKVLIVRGDAALVLEGLGHNAKNVTVRVTGQEADEPQTVITVEGGKAKTIAFYSAKTIDDIKTTDIPNIVALYDSKVLDCTIHLLQVKENSRFETLSTSRKSIFGKSVVYDELAKKIGSF